MEQPIETSDPVAGSIIEASLEDLITRRVIVSSSISSALRLASDEAKEYVTRRSELQTALKAIPSPVADPIVEASLEDLITRRVIVSSSISSALRLASDEVKEYVTRRRELQTALKTIPIPAAGEEEEEDDDDVEETPHSTEELLDQLIRLRKKTADPLQLTPIFPTTPVDRQEEGADFVRGPYFKPSDPDTLNMQMLNDILDVNSALANISNAMIEIARESSRNGLLIESALGLGTQLNVHTRDFEDNILRQPFSFERNCAKERDCVGFREFGDILVECLEPNHVASKAAGQSIPRQMCLRCKRMFAQMIYMKIQHQGFREGETVELIDFCNIVEVPGQYKIQQCMYIVGHMMVVAENPRLYDRVWNNEERIYYHKQSRYVQCTTENQLVSEDFQRDDPSFPPPSRQDGSSSSSSSSSSSASQNSPMHSIGGTNPKTGKMTALYTGNFSDTEKRYIPPERNGSDLSSFLKLRLCGVAPPWVTRPFGSGASDYYRKEGEFVWRPLLFPMPVSSYTLYIDLVNRVDYCERLLRSGRIRLKTDEMALDEWMNCHIPLIVYLSEIGSFDNEAILQTKEIWPREGIGFGKSSMPDTALHVLHCSFWGPSPITMTASTDLTLIRYFIKALPLPCYARSFSNTVKKSWTIAWQDDILIDCLSRILACGLLGIYAHVSETPSFHVRCEVHRWFVFDRSARGKDHFTAWVKENSQLFTTLLREWVIYQLSTLPGALAYFRETYWWCAITRFVYECANETRIALARDSDPRSRQLRWSFRPVPGSTQQYKLREEKPPRWKQFCALLKEYSTRSRKRIPKVILLEFPAMVCSIADQMEIATAKHDLQSLPWASRYVDLDGLRAHDLELSMRDNCVTQRTSGSGRKNKLSIGKVRYWSEIPQIDTERAVVREAVQLAERNLSSQQQSFETLARSLGVSLEHAIIPLMRARDEYESETDRSKIVDVLLAIRLHHPRDYAILIEIFRAQLEAGKLRLLSLPEHFCELQAARTREIYSLKEGDAIPPFAGLYAVCRECGIFKGKIVGRPETGRLSLLRLNSPRAITSCDITRWLRVFDPPSAGDKKSTRQSTKKERLRLKKRQSLMLAARKISSSTTRQERAMLLQTEKSSEVRDIIYNPITGASVCKRTLGRNRTFVRTSAKKLAELQKTRDRWDAFVHTLIKQYRRDEVDTRCKHSQVTTVNMLGRLLISQKDGYIALCCDCLRPFKCTMLSFDARAVLVCGCKETEAATSNSATAVRDSFEASAQNKRAGKECCFPTCMVRQNNGDDDGSESDIVLRHPVFDDQNLTKWDDCAVLCEAAFCRKHAYAVKENARKSIVRLSLIVRAYQQNYRLVKLGDGKSVRYVYVEPRKPQMIRI